MINFKLGFKITPLTIYITKNINKCRPELIYGHNTMSVIVFTVDDV